MKAFLFVAGVGLLASTSLGALPSNYTVVDVPGGDGGEPGILEIAQHIIDGLHVDHGGVGSPGALFTNVNQVNTQSIFSAGDWKLTRIQDNAGSGPTSLGNVLNISQTGVSGITDQVMRDGIAAIDANARYAGFGQTFGFRDTASGGPTAAIANVTGSGFNATFSGGQATWDASLQTTDGFWRWARGGTQGIQGSTLVGDNGSNGDVAITFQVYNASLGYLAWIVAFEDKVGPRDFNDLVVLIEPQNFVVVPLPHAGALAGVGLLGLFGIRRRKTL